MFSSITSYLFGAVDDETETNLIDRQPENEPKRAATPETKDDDEWILVEKSELRHGKRSRQQSPLEARKRVHHSDHAESMDPTNTYTPLCHFQEPLSHDGHDDGSPERGEPHDTSDSDMSTVAYPMMDESWLVTPPACFTAGTSKMETSSMENLLIEHPSMSVYHHRGRQSSTGVDSDNSESSNDGESTNRGNARAQAGLARHEAQHRPRPLTPHTNLTQVKTIKYMQQSQQRQLYKNLSHNNMRRSNLTHHARGKVTRSHVVQQPRTRQMTNNKQC